MAGISPVITAVSGLPSNVPDSTVVSRVLGKQFAKIVGHYGIADESLRGSDIGFYRITTKLAIR